MVFNKKKEVLKGNSYPYNTSKELSCKYLATLFLYIYCILQLTVFDGT